jgi:hypothetical protein
MATAAVLAGCASESAKNSTSAASAQPVAAVAADPASTKPAAEATATQAAMAEQPALDDNEVICRNEKPLGTRIGKRVCKTRAQLKQEEASAQEMMKNRDKKSHGVTDGITGGG